MNFSELSVLITGGTGSFGNAFVKCMINRFHPKRLIVFSRDELKQSEMAKQIDYPGMRFFIGDVRDQARLSRAFHGVDIVIHAAALKQVPTLEYNPFEAILTNVIGSENIIAAALDQNVKKVVALSTDKAVNPINLYGATKLCAEKLFVAANSYSGANGTKFSAVRYGNVIGSRGSVIPLFLAQKQTGVITITDSRMTRFWLSLDQAVDTVLYALEHMQGGEIYVPKVPAVNILDLAKIVAPGCQIKNIGIRPGEKLHEILITEDEGVRTFDAGDYYSILPTFDFRNSIRRENYKKLPENFKYSSDDSPHQLAGEELQALINQQVDVSFAKVAP